MKASAKLTFIACFSAALLLFSAQASPAGSATWSLNPGSGDWNTATNWTPATVPNGPGDTATFALSNITGVSDSLNTEVNGIVFNAGASAFTITASPAFTLTISGVGITNNSGITQNFVTVADGAGNVGFIGFTNSTTAGSLTAFTNNGGTVSGGFGPGEFFLNTSTAGNANFTNNGSAVSGAFGGQTSFHDSSTTGNGTFTNNGGSVSGAFGGSVFFFNSSTAGNATLIANGGLGGGGGGFIQIDTDSTGGTARVEVFGNGTGDSTNGNLDISFHNAPGVTTGSIEGSGAVFLGANNLTVGGNNLNTTFSGVIQDGGANGSFTKVGTGILTFEGGTSNDHIADTVTLNIANGSTVNLNFGGNADAIGGLIVDGVVQSDGLYGSAASGAPNQLSVFAGTGVVLVGPPVITSPLTATATVNLAFSYQFETIGASSLAVDDLTLPQGLFFDPALRAIVGTPTVEGTFQVGLSATNAAGTTNATLILTVQPFPAAGPVIISVTSATGRTGSPFIFQVITSGGSPAARLTARDLPAGLSADAVTGEISGTVTTDGSFLVTLSATDAGITNAATLQLTFTSDLAVPVIRSANSAFLFPSLDFLFTIDAPTSDSVDPVTYSEIGPLPPGLGLDVETGVISGTPKLNFGLQPMPSLAGGVVTNVQIFACNSNGCATQGLFFLLPTGAANISTRLGVGTDADVLIGGFIAEGNAPMKLVMRGIGPSLAQFGVSGVLPNPYLELHSGLDTIASNDNWKDNLTGGSQEVAIENTGLAPSDPLESAILGVLDPGGYTAILKGTSNGTGVGLVEVYTLGAASMDVSSEARLANISTRGEVQTGDNVMIGGFINKGATPIKVLVRGIGPLLTQYGVSGALANPTLELHKPDGTVVTNDDWMTDQEADIMVTGLAPTNALEAAILITLPVGEGGYTAMVRGANNTTGVGLVEAYFGNPCLGTSCP